MSFRDVKDYYGRLGVAPPPPSSARTAIRQNGPTPTAPVVTRSPSEASPRPTTCLAARTRAPRTTPCAAKSVALAATLVPGPAGPPRGGPSHLGNRSPRPQGRPLIKPRGRPLIKPRGRPSIRPRGRPRTKPSRRWLAKYTASSRHSRVTLFSIRSSASYGGRGAPRSKAFFVADAPTGRQSRHPP